ncbi:MAG: translation initiation factor IF-2, partial [Clostridiales bacterium]|nr:translation initiation factor IF-2 [Clostridiales bacterium]
QGQTGSRPQGQRLDERGSQLQGRTQGQTQRADQRGSQYNQGRPQGQQQRYQRPSQGGTQYGQGKQQGMNRQQTRPQQQGGRDQRTTEQGSNYQGSQNYQGNRYNKDQRQDQRQGQRQGQRPSGNRTGGYNSGTYRRPSGNQAGGQRSGYNNYETFKKDEDDKPTYNRSQGNRRGSASSDRKNFDQQILDQKMAEKNDFSNKRYRDRINKDKNHRDKGSSKRDIETDISKLAPKKGQFIKPEPVVQKEEEIKVITLPEVLTIKELADKMKVPSSALIKKLFLAGQVVTINQEITFEEAEEIALEYDIISEKEVIINEVEELLKEDEEDPKTLVKRPPVVCVMGHVDHGKTSLLDAIRHANVTSREAGGITQHIGAYMVEIQGEKITFLDTPGHEAFTSMRMRGAQATDIAILVVAADDGVMPQTIEAISHAKAAGVKIIVAINKIDKPSANVERVKQELTEYELIAEDWGGDTIFVPVSAHTHEGIEQLLEMILLTAEMEELKANPDRKARGLVIEAELDKGRGSVATILVQKGTLHVGDNIAVGSSYGKVRAMINDKGVRVEEAGPSTPVEILGLNSVPDVGEIFMATENEKEARNIAEAFIAQDKEKLIADTKAKLSLDGLFSQIQAGNIKELNLIIKADVQGSVEAMKQSLLKLSNDEVAVRVIHGGVGAINESDIILATTSNGIIIGFNVKPDNMAKERAELENVDIKLYHVIYDAINDVESAMKGLLDPVYEEKVIGHAEVRQIFKASGIGNIAGSYVLDGKIVRGSKARIYRGSELVYDGILSSLKRFQDDVKEVAAGYECGLVFDKFNDIKVEDKVEFFVMVEVPR